MKLAQLGEFGFIERIRAAASSGEGVALGIGDDCAATTLTAGELLLTSTDLLLEDVHFSLGWTDLRQLGRKCVAVNVSDIAAMGGRPRHLFLGVGVPAELAVEQLDLFLEGFLEAAAGYGAALVGGDTCRSAGPLMISVTVQGAAPQQQVVRRSGARPGDAVYVSGTLGDSALALALLQGGHNPDPYLLARHHDPTARTALGWRLAQAGLATAMIDVSDGLVADLGHILKASGVGARLQAELLPLSAPYREALGAGEERLPLALSGGEDYELLFTVAPQQEVQLPALAAELDLSLTRVGTLTPPEGGVVVLDEHGSPVSLGRQGFNHFGA